jgi:hypothetical protein
MPHQTGKRLRASLASPIKGSFRLIRAKIHLAPAFIVVQRIRKHALVFHTTSYNLFCHCMIGGSNPLASPAALRFTPSSVAPHLALENFLFATLPLTLT